ncbi:hypothetical protein WN48_10767 [Eufriesea mexicana]|uniref:Uncharacterized protein n=1 Tax=Eufriesea mexicana TaxID=516756 RepID=A0A310S693_9HYME|nr:hypothetical protein WN48_10767 [Eufriesea mexicana]
MKVFNRQNCCPAYRDRVPAMRTGAVVQIEMRFTGYSLNKFFAQTRRVIPPFD